jgi:beta-glucosidase
MSFKMGSMNWNINKVGSFLIFLIGVAILITSCQSNSSGKKSYAFEFQNPELPAEERAELMVAQMTLSEKVSQMRYDAPAIDRLGIPQYNWWNECLHGVGRAGEATVFPQAIGMGASWNPSLLSEIAVAISDEARAKHHKFVSEGKRGIYQGLTFWTPNINIFRDPRWGRGQETYGEDPFLTSRMGVSLINGLQGNDEKYLKVVATAKHFAVHSGPERTRHEDNYEASNKDLKETYLPAFKAAVKEANVQSVMCAYNRFRSEACCGSNLLLDSILRREWGFDGYVVSDCWAINDFYEEGRHGVSANAQEASALAVKMGTDINCGNTYDPNLTDAVLAQLIDEATVDRALVRLMTARFKLGMFDDPALVPFAQIPYSVVCSPKHYQLSLKAAQESMVLLKNDNNALPLSKTLKNIAVIGPNANAKQSILGNYHGTSKNNITPLMGIRSKLPNANVIYAKGSDIAEGWPLLTPIPTAFLSNDGKPGLLGEYFANAKWEGEAAIARMDKEIDFIWLQRPIAELATDTFTVKWTGQLTPTEAGEYRIGLRACNAGKLYINGENVLDFSDNHQPQMKYYDMKLKANQAVNIVVEYYNFHADPQVQLLWAKMGEDLLTPALAAASQSEVVIMFLGLSPDIEGEEMPVTLEGFDKGDRSDIVLPRSQRVLLQAILDTGKPVVLVLMNGSALAINDAAAKVPAILEAWYPGEFGGNAIADVLFGDFNPGGKLPLTFYKSVKDLPAFQSYDMTGRTYKYFQGEPLFPFGHGLSYTQFAYSNLTLPSQLKDGETLNVAVDVTNSGDFDGDEVVQVYIKSLGVEKAANRSLVAFERVQLKKGEKKTVTFELSANQFETLAADGSLIRGARNLELSVGGKQPGFAGIADAKTTEVLVKRISIE